MMKEFKWVDMPDGRFLREVDIDQLVSESDRLKEKIKDLESCLSECAGMRCDNNCANIDVRDSAYINCGKCPICRAKIIMGFAGVWSLDEH